MAHAVGPMKSQKGVSALIAEERTFAIPSTFAASAKNLTNASVEENLTNASVEEDRVSAAISKKSAENSKGAVAQAGGPMKSQNGVSAARAQNYPSHEW